MPFQIDYVAYIGKSANMPTRTAFQTISWGIQINNFPDVVSLIQAGGFDGIEIAQRPDCLGISDARELENILADRGMTLVSLSGGTLRERVDFCGGYHPEYLFVEHWDLGNVQYAVERGFRIAIHPRAFSPVSRLSDVLRLADQFHDLHFIVDTAHVALAGESIDAYLNELGDRIISIHLKDWHAQYGRSSQRWARGICDLGEGKANLESTLNAISSRHFPRWIVAEVDSVPNSIHESISKSSKWLNEQGWISFPNFKKIDELASLDCGSIERREANRSGGNAFRRFLNEGARNAKKSGMDVFYVAVANAFKTLFDCRLVTVSSCHATRSDQYHITPRVQLADDLLLAQTDTPKSLQGELTGVAVFRQAPATVFDLAVEIPGAQYGYPDRIFKDKFLLTSLDLTQMISVPIYNEENRNYVKMVVDLFPRKPQMFSQKDILELYWFGQEVTSISSLLVDSLCLEAMEQVNHCAMASENAFDFFAQITQLIANNLSCEGVAIFMIDDAGTKLEIADERLSTGTIWMHDEHFYRKGEGLTGSVWELRETIIGSQRNMAHSPKSAEQVKNEHQFTNIWMPFFAETGGIIGVARCRNKKSALVAGSIIGFTNEDAAILDSILKGTTPHYNVRRYIDRDVRLVGTMHELYRPLLAIKSITNLLEHDSIVTHSSSGELITDLRRWCDVLNRLRFNADATRIEASPKPHKKWVDFKKDIFLPAKEQIFLHQAEKSYDLIIQEYLVDLPNLYLDPDQFQQVLFNLFLNSVKYSGQGTCRIEVTINTHSSRNIEIKIRDWGLGVTDEVGTDIFGKFVRYPIAGVRYPVGQGIGLWVVKQIVEAHQGEISLSSRKRPTEFSINLPFTNQTEEIGSNDSA